MFKFFNARLIASLEAENARLVWRLSATESTINKYKAQATAAKAAQAASDKEKAKLQQSVADLRKHNSELGKQLFMQDEEIEDLEAHLDAAEAANDCLLKRNLQLSNAVAQLAFREMFTPRTTAAEATLRDQLRSRDITILNSKTREEALVKERDSLKADVWSLKKQRTALVNKREELRSANKRLAATMVSVSGDLAVTAYRLGNIVGKYSGFGSSIPMEAMEKGKKFYDKLLQRRPGLAPASTSRYQPPAKAA